MNELTDYLARMETRLATIEAENTALRNALGQVKQQAAAKTFKTERGLPNTGIISDSFFTRAFTIWGHHFVAQLIITVPLFICYLIFVFALVASEL